MRSVNRTKLLISHPFSSFIYFLSDYINKKRINFKREMLIEKYDINPSFGIHFETSIYGDGKISIGDKTYFGKNTFVASNPAEAHISFGKNCRISHGCHFRTEDNDPTTLGLTKPIKKHKNIIIGDNCWIGANVFMRGGVKLGNNVTVGANSVVLSSFPSDVIIGGIPAKILKSL